MKRTCYVPSLVLLTFSFIGPCSPISADEFYWPEPVPGQTEPTPFIEPVETEASEEQEIDIQEPTLDESINPLDVEPNPFGNPMPQNPLQERQLQEDRILPTPLQEDNEDFEHPLQERPIPRQGLDRTPLQEKPLQEKRIKQNPLPRNRLQEKPLQERPL